MFPYNILYICPYLFHRYLVFAYLNLLITKEAIPQNTFYGTASILDYLFKLKSSSIIVSDVVITLELA